MLVKTWAAPVDWAARSNCDQVRKARIGEGNENTDRERQVDYLWTDMVQWAFWVAVGQIIWINILLSGDNAVVIALACRSLPPKQRFWGILLGAGAAVVLRIVFTVVIAQIMLIPFLKLVGGLLLLWIAIKLIVPSEAHGEDSVKAGDTLWRAVWLVTVADIVMSLDNVIAIAAAAETAAMRVDMAHALTIKTTLIVFGLTTSVPLIIAGSALLMKVMERFPILVWAGAALLGWVAGEIIVKDAAVESWFGAAVVDRWHLWGAGIGAVFVVAAGWLIRKIHHKELLDPPLIIDTPDHSEFPHREPSQQQVRDRI
jgi:YjbE family integral membrane protein